MNSFKKTLGNILYGITSFISFVFDLLIFIVNTIVVFVRSIAKGFGALLSMGGCILIFLFMGPFGFLFLFNPVVIFIILSFIIIPILGTKFVSYLKYIRYTITEYLYDRSDYLMSGKESTFRSFNEYGNKYKKMEYERKRQEQEKRRAEQQKQWEERFNQWYQYQNSQSSYKNYENEQWQQNKSGYGSTFGDPTTDFKNKYEKSCDLLEIGYDSDKYEVKLAYRKKAKENHPDLNKSPDATRKFQEINEAYEFLSDGNIERYKSIN